MWVNIIHFLLSNIWERFYRELSLRLSELINKDNWNSSFKDLVIFNVTLIDFITIFTICSKFPIIVVLILSAKALQLGSECNLHNDAKAILILKVN